MSNWHRSNTLTENSSPIEDRRSSASRSTSEQQRVLNHVAGASCTMLYQFYAIFQKFVLIFNIAFEFFMLNINKTQHNANFPRVLAGKQF